MKTSSVIKTNMIFVIRTPNNPVAATLYDLTGLDFPDFWAIDLAWKVNQ